MFAFSAQLLRKSSLEIYQVYSKMFNSTLDATKYSTAGHSKCEDKLKI